MPEFVDRLLATLSASARRSGILANVGFAVMLAVSAVAFFPGRIHLVVFTIVVWSLFLGHLRPQGYGPLAILAVLLFWLVTYADALNYGIIRAHNVLAYTALIMAVFGMAVVAHRAARGSVRLLALLGAYLAGVVIALTALLYILHIRMFGVPVTPAVLNAIYQTQSLEVHAFLGEFGSVRKGLVVVAAVTVPALFIFGQHLTRVRRVAPLPLAALVLIAVGLTGYHHERLRIFHLIISGSLEYRRELAVFRELQAQRAAGALPIEANKDGRGETYVVVIGESANRNHMGLYGYHRDTTPLLDSLHAAGELLRFTNAFSTHTHTVLVLPKALTAASQRNDAPLVEAPSVLDVARAAGIQTHWITNQALYGAWDNLVSILAHGADRLVPLNRVVGTSTETRRFDEVAILELERILAERSEQNRLIIVHLMGSHWRYCDRVPAAFLRYTGDSLDPGEFGMARGRYIAENLNCYDSSMLYSDHVVAGLLRATQRSGGPAAFVYFADHGQDVLNGYGHHSEKFTFAMAEIPLVAWFSEDYRRLYPSRVEALQTRSGQPFPSDFLFDTLLGIAGISTRHYDARADLSDPSYDSSDIELRLVNGTRRFRDAENVRYHQRHNIVQLASRGLLDRVLPHRVNSTGKLAEVLFDGHRALEVDVLFRERAGGGYFEPGHDDGHASGNELAAFLARMPIDSMPKLWLDVKNLHDGNLAAVRAALGQLSTAFDLRPRIIVESPAVELLATIGEDGFHTSYYLPTAHVLRLSERAAHDSLRVVASNIARQVDQAGVAAVSFDAGLYPFVKEYLEPLLGSSIVFHTWDLNLSLGDPHFQTKLAATAFFGDPRVATILVHYASQLSL